MSKILISSIVLVGSIVFSSLSTLAQNKPVSCGANDVQCMFDQQNYQQQRSPNFNVTNSTQNNERRVDNTTTTQNNERRVDNTTTTCQDNNNNNGCKTPITGTNVQQGQSYDYRRLQPIRSNESLR